MMIIIYFELPNLAQSDDIRDFKRLNSSSDSLLKMYSKMKLINFAKSILTFILQAKNILP